ncbi:MAG: VOC family protein [Flavobacterium sp.]|nr:MAG: VOC family protein [Flavobacterium sp.]
MKVPSNYLPVMPYLILNDSKGFLEFAKQVFNAQEQMIVPGENGQIMHGEIKIHDAVIMFAQASENFASKGAGMFIYVENVDKVYEIALKNKAISLMPAEEKDYGYTAGFEDPFENQWWIVQG